MIARAYIRQFRRKYYPKGEYKLAVELMRDVESEERIIKTNYDIENRKGEYELDTKEGKQSETANTENII